MWLLSAIWGAVGFLDLIKVEFLPEKFQSYTAVRAIHWLSWRSWLFVMLILLIGVILEGGHAAIQKREGLIERHKQENAQLQTKLQSSPVPKVFIHYELTQESLKFPGIVGQKKTLVLENTSDIDAYDVQVQDVQLDPGHCNATFLPLSLLKGRTRQSVNTIIRGSVPEKEKDNFEMVLYACGATDTTTWFKVPIVVIFRDYERQWYSALFNFQSDNYFSSVDISLENWERIKSPTSKGGISS